MLDRTAAGRAPQPYSALTIMSDLTASKNCDPSTAAQPRDGSCAQDCATFTTAPRLAVILGIFVAAALLYWPSTLELDRLWRNVSGETYTHGYLVLLLSIWLIVGDRKQLAVAPIRWEPLMLFPLAVLSAAWIWFWRAAIQELQLLLLPLILFSALFAALGRRIARLLVFPVGFLYFALPFWDDINGIVQGLSAKVTGLLIWTTGIPAYVSGHFVHLPGGTIEIARSCSGLHEFIVGLALATVYGKLSNESWRRRLIWIGVMGSLSLAVNWVRISTVVIAAYETDMRSSLVENHYWLGWWLFAFVFAGFLWWTGRRPAIPDGPSSDEHRHGSRDSPAGAMRMRPVVGTLAVLAALPVLAYGMDWANSTPTPLAAIQWPVAPAGWKGPMGPQPSDWQPYFVNPSSESLAKYLDPNGQSIEAFVVVYRVQTQRAKLLGYGNDLLGRKDPLRQQSERLASSPDGHWREIMVVDSGGSRSLIWVRYRIGSRLFVQPRVSQLWYGLIAVAKPPVSSLTALRSKCVPNCEAARGRLSAATQWLRPAL